MSPLSPEATVARNFVDWVLALPWTERTDDALDVAKARVILDEDHYGLVEVKERILDYIAVLSLVGKLEGPILCLVGPPGVGKTSLGRSVARALGRRFARMSLGGVRDEAEIRGHRRTYIGAMPGRVIQAMRRAEVVNPVILLDEIDKLGQDYRGDPASALLEVLDPEQNRTFSDHYLEVDYDLSHVLFITTANSLSTIPEPLRDRMEIIRLPGYLDLEKQAIARQFLIPKQLRQNGLDPASVTFEPATRCRRSSIATRARPASAISSDGWRAIARKLAPPSARSRDAVVSCRAGEARRRARAPRHRAKRSRSKKARNADTAMLQRAAPRRATCAQSVGPDDLRALLGVAPYDPDDMSLDDKVGVATGPRLHVGRRRDARDRGRRRARPRQGAAHRDVRRRHEGVGQRRAQLRAVARRGARHRSRLSSQPRPARAHPRRRDAEGRTVRGHRDCDGGHQRAHRTARSRRHGDDRRDHAPRPRAADRWAQGEVRRGASQRHRARDHSVRQRA